jgi:hypothetical protein
LYNVGFLVLGNYTVTATAPGFETASVGPFIVQIDQIVTADAKLQVGKASTTVNVVSGPVVASGILRTPPLAHRSVRAPWKTCPWMG